MGVGAVFGVDPDIAKCELAETFGIKVLNLVDGVDPVSGVFEHTGGMSDGALITASTSSSQPLHVAAQLLPTAWTNRFCRCYGIRSTSRPLFIKKSFSPSKLVVLMGPDVMTHLMKKVGMITL